MGENTNIETQQNAAAWRTPSGRNIVGWGSSRKSRNGRQHYAVRPKSKLCHYYRLVFCILKAKAGAFEIEGVWRLSTTKSRRHFGVAEDFLGSSISAAEVAKPDGRGEWNRTAGQK